MMTEEDRILLLKDLCCRVPYGTMVEIHGSYDDGEEYIRISELDAPMVNYVFDEEKSIKPYLRPMSSMTEDEKLHVNVNYRFFYNDGVFENIDIFETGGYYDRDGNYNEIMTQRATLHVTMNDVLNLINWLNSHHFDYRGLIEKGLAIEVTDENNHL